MKQLLPFFFLMPVLLFGQEEEKSSWLKKLERYKIQPTAAVQLWSTYTHGAEVYNENSGERESVDDRLNTQLHRSRLGIKGQPYKNLKFNLTAALDFVGRDPLAGTVGGVNNGASPAFRAWNAFVQWRISDDESLNLTGGYFAPRIGRESMTAAFRVASMEKAWSQNYLRRHLTGTGPGRSVGLNLGGLLPGASEKFAFRYDVGIFNSKQNALVVGAENSAAPLFVGRLETRFGATGPQKYGLGINPNFYQKRTGLSFAVAGAWQGNNGLAKENYAAGFDFAANVGRFVMDGEWTYMVRKRNMPLSVGSESVEANTGYIRLNFNSELNKGYLFSPYFMLVTFNGATDFGEQLNALTLGFFSGTDHSFNFGFNFFFNPDLKLTVNYSARSGENGDISDGQNINNLFWQSGAGSIRRGNWFGLGLAAVL